MKKFKDKQEYLQSQADYWNTVSKRPGFSAKNEKFKKRCLAFLSAVNSDLEKVTNFDKFVKNNFREWKN